MINWHLEKRKISTLKAHPKNPRKLSDHDYSHLKQSLEKYGLIDKVIINTDNQIIGGHQRLHALKKMGIKEVEVWVPDKTLEPKEADELNIRLNRATGEWDWDILANEWNPNDLIEWGFTPEELFQAADQIESDEEDSEILQPINDEDAKTKLGDRYQLDGHVVVCGDSTLPETVKACIGEGLPILMVTDPPYGVSYDAKWREEALSDGGKRAKGKVQNDEQINWSLAWHLFPGSIAYVWHAGRFAADVQKSLEDSQFEICSQIIWVKQHFALSRGDYHWQHEPCWYAVKKGHNHNWQGSRKESTIWEVANLNAFGTNKDDERTAHSTQKPIECMAKPIRNNTAKGEAVYDPFLGSGTTLIAAEQLDRVCYGIELSPAYCDMIVERWIKYRKKLGKDHSVIKNGIDCRDFNATAS